MLLVPCPHCGPRNSADLGYLGENPTRPDPDATDAEAWRDYLYLRDNPADWLQEGDRSSFAPGLIDETFRETNRPTFQQVLEFGTG